MKFIPGFGRALRSAMQWRLLLLWTVLTLIVTELLAFPIGQFFSSRLDHSVYAADWSKRLDLVMAADLSEAIESPMQALSGTGIVALVLIFILIPFLNGIFVAASRSPTRVKLGELIREGLRQYGPMFRMMFMALLPLAVAVLAVWGSMKGVKRYGEHAILKSDLNHLKWAANAVSLVILAWANATVDAGRASLALNPGKRSAIKAWWRGLKLVFMHPLRSVALYLSVTVLAAIALAIVTWLRSDVGATSRWSFLFALLLTQLLVAVTAWMHYARLFAMVELTRAFHPPPAT